jgi:hypothetical protein
LFVTISLVSSYIMAARRRQCMPFWLSLSNFQRDADRNKLISYSLYKFILNPSTSATSNPLRRGFRGWGVFIYGNHAARWENGTSWWGCLCDVCFASKKSSKREFFIPAGTHLAVKLLTQSLGGLLMFLLVTCQSYLSYVHFRGVTKWATQACTIPLV